MDRCSDGGSCGAPGKRVPHDRASPAGRRRTRTGLPARATAAPCSARSASCGTGTCRRACLRQIWQHCRVVHCGAVDVPALPGAGRPGPVRCATRTCGPRQTGGCRVVAAPRLPRPAPHRAGRCSCWRRCQQRRGAPASFRSRSPQNIPRTLAFLASGGSVNLGGLAYAPALCGWASNPANNFGYGAALLLLGRLVGWSKAAACATPCRGAGCARACPTPPHPAAPRRPAALTRSGVRRHGQLWAAGLGRQPEQQPGGRVLGLALLHARAGEGRGLLVGMGAWGLEATRGTCTGTRSASRTSWRVSTRLAHTARAGGACRDSQPLLHARACEAVQQSCASHLCGPPACTCVHGRAAHSASAPP